jgi:hypothetical protein
MEERLLNIKEVCKIVGLKKSTIYLYIQQNNFPKAKKNWKVKQMEIIRNKKVDG